MWSAKYIEKRQISFRITVEPIKELHENPDFNFSFRANNMGGGDSSGRLVKNYYFAEMEIFYVD